jgi:hypothetical protein
MELVITTKGTAHAYARVREEKTVSSSPPSAAATRATPSAPTNDPNSSDEPRRENSCTPKSKLYRIDGGTRDTIELNLRKRFHAAESNELIQP